MKPIGGFLELELPEGSVPYHRGTIQLISGRACLNLIIRERKPKKIYLPFYICDALLEPIKLNRIPFEYYQITSDFEPKHVIELKQDEYFLYVNYFGLKTNAAHNLSRKYKNNFILDNVHAFFEKEYTGTWAFNSARKFFGVPDGAYLYAPYYIRKDFKRNRGTKYNHLINRLLGKQKIAFRQFVKNEKSVSSDLYDMSILSEKILNCTDFTRVARKRRENFNFLHKNLKQFNQLHIRSVKKCVPYCYPLLPERTIHKEKLYDQSIFVPTLWKRSHSTKNKHFQFERDLVKRLLPLPVDQRYKPDDLQRMVDYIPTLLTD